MYAVPTLNDKQIVDKTASFLVYAQGAATGDKIGQGKSEDLPETALKQGRMRPSGVTTSYSGCVFWKKSGFRADMITCRNKLEFHIRLLVTCWQNQAGNLHLECKYALFLLDGFTQGDMITSHS